MDPAADIASEFVEDYFMVEDFDQGGRPRAVLKRGELIGTLAELLESRIPTVVAGELKNLTDEIDRLGNRIAELTDRTKELTRHVERLEAQGG